MKNENIVIMMNRIGEFFEVMPDRAGAEVDIATHVRKFWAPSMRQALKKFLEQDKGEGLKPIILESLTKHEDKWL
jgi:formate dehydrogenase subunit delta